MAFTNTKNSLLIGLLVGCLLGIAIAAPVDSKIKDDRKPTTLDKQLQEPESAKKYPEGTTMTPTEKSKVNKVAGDNDEILQPGPPTKRQPLEAPSKRQYGPALLDENMPDEVPEMDELNSQGLLTDPRLIQEIIEEEKRLQLLEAIAPQVDLRPSAMAEYLLATGDLAGVVDMVNDLVTFGAMSEDEGREYRMAVESEYSSLLNKNINDKITSLQGVPSSDSNLPVFNDKNVAYPNAIQHPEYETESDFAAGIPYNGVDLAEDYYTDLLKQSPYYDEIMKDIISGLVAQEARNEPPSDYNPGFPLIEDDQSNDLKENSLEEELKDLPSHTAKVFNNKDQGSDNKSEAENELAFLSSQNSGKHPNDNRTKSIKVNSSELEEKKRA